jgi:hypothetical protein
MAEDKSQETPEVPDLPDAVDEPAAGKSPGPWRRRLHGYIFVGDADKAVSQVPGSGTTNGERAIAKAMADVLDSVRRSIRNRSTRARVSPSPRI